MGFLKKLLAALPFLAPAATSHASAHPSSPRFDVVLLDPPTFSQSRERGVFRAESDLAELVGAGAGVLRPGGVLFVSTNAARLAPEHFLEAVGSGLAATGLRARSDCCRGTPQYCSVDGCGHKPWRTNDWPIRST